ncbi:MAG: hypothetical protein DRH08_12900 [Deltaproteobacteria bacterium]|nr:MAG: hypothetical protein DRH08_12900 [Deltaproteobacteria bacterium]
MSGLLRANFPNPGDGTGDGYEEAYEAWLTIGQLEKDGWLVPVTIDENLIVESDIPDGQGYDWVIVQVPKAGRYAVVSVDAALGGGDD